MLSTHASFKFHQLSEFNLFAARKVGAVMSKISLLFIQVGVADVQKITTDDLFFCNCTFF